MKLEEWIDKYNKKTPTPFTRDKSYSLLFDEQHGFAEVKKQEDLLIVRCFSGDGRYWQKNVFPKIAKQFNCKAGGTWCLRNQLAYIKLFGYKVKSTEELPDGLKRYHCVNKEGKKGLVSPAFKFKTGEQAYFITWEF